MRRVLPAVVLVCLSVAAAPLRADDVTGAGRVLCATLEVMVSTEDGECAAELAANLNVPQFFEIDLETGRLSTTAASGENRATAVDAVKRDGGLIVLQGFEQGRAFSFVITEETGTLTVAVARDGFAVTGFGACTPLATVAGSGGR